MARRNISHDPVEAHVNLTPMIDVTFQLIIFFMLVTELANLALAHVVLAIAPHSEVPEGTGEVHGQLIINISHTEDNEGKISFGGGDELTGTKELILRRLKERLQLEVNTYDIWEKKPRSGRGISKLKLLVRSDHRVYAEYFLLIMHVCNEVGIYKVDVAAKQSVVQE